MTANELKHIIPQGETTTVQFKKRTDDAYKMGTEMVAFSNSQGGLLIIGVDDKTGAITGLTFGEIQQTNALLVNAASENVKPAIVISTQTVDIDGQNVIVATIPQGKDKPYKDNKGIIWVKNGSDKRKVFSNTELRVMMQNCGNLAADKDSVEGSSYKDISLSTLRHFLYERYTAECVAAGITNTLIQTTEIDAIVNAIDVNFTIGQLLQNISLMDEKGQLTLSGLLLLGNSIQRYRPVFTVKCVSFVGNSMATSEFRDKMPDREIEGSLLHQYNAAISFITRNLKSIQVEENFNSIARLEIPLDVFVEILTNALIHRDYYQNSPIRLFIFDNRIEICSPGILPDSVTEDSIKEGISKPRNQLLFDNAKYLLPYTGIGSGIIRAMKSYNHITFENSYAKEEFVVTVHRQEIDKESVQDKPKSVYDGVQDGVYDEKILAFAVMAKSRKEIMDLIGLSTHSDNYERYMLPLLKKGLLAMTLPDKPNSKNQKYITTEQGKKSLMRAEK
ncbi:hypothetical protein EZS27_021354 [termite gut metagenome]|uniref:ATP-dependent DNA helicase RecG n=1 Tax=termite gut metagenome TaxID=433724 RepID=A0A5J4R8E5_9ZZZZ